MMKSTKTPPKTTLLDEARTIGYMEGYSDGRNELLNELIKHKLLIKGWKSVLNEKSTSNYKIK